MKDKIQIALLAVIAVALGLIAWKQFAGEGSATSSTDESSTTNSSLVANDGSPAKPASGPTFDPMATNTTTAVVDNTPKTTVTFAKYEHDFGKVKQDTKNKFVFAFTNTGKEPLIIESATGSCGCTVPNYPKAPIAPGATGQIEVEYSPGKQENAQQKTVTVVANTEPKQTELRIKAFVEPGTGNKDAAAAGGSPVIEVGR